MEAFTKEIVPDLESYTPDLLIIFAGFDAHKDDQLANINLTEESFGKLIVLMQKAADKYCGGKLVSVLEGSYDLEALARSVETHDRVMCNSPPM